MAEDTFSGSFDLPLVPFACSGSRGRRSGWQDYLPLR